MQNIVNIEKSTGLTFSPIENLEKVEEISKSFSIEEEQRTEDNSKKIPKKRKNKKRKSKFCDKTSICHFYPCMKKFTSRENLDIHISNIHLKQKPFQCNYCESKFSHLSGICSIILGRIYHERTQHLKFLPFVCRYKSKV